MKKPIAEFLVEVASECDIECQIQKAQGSKNDYGVVCGNPAELLGVVIGGFYDMAGDELSEREYNPLDFCDFKMMTLATNWVIY